MTGTLHHIHLEECVCKWQRTSTNQNSKYELESAIKVADLMLQVYLATQTTETTPLRHTTALCTHVFLSP